MTEDEINELFYKHWSPGSSQVLRNIVEAKKAEARNGDAMRQPIDDPWEQVKKLREQAQKARQFMRHAWNCSDHSPITKSKLTCTCGLTAFLAELDSSSASPDPAL